MKIKIIIVLSFVWLLADCRASQTTIESTNPTAAPSNVVNTPSPEKTPPIAAAPESVKPTTSTQQANVKPAAAKTSESAVVIADYNKIQKGMDYKQVAAIIGSPGENAGDFKDGGGTITLYRWTGKSDEGEWTLSAKFQNGKLADKSQFGLK